MSERFKVEIYGQTYSMQGDLDPVYVEELSRYVDEKMRSIGDATGLVDSVRVAVLASLSIADELHTLRKSNQELRGDLRDRAEKCLTVVERALRQTA
jgi:cell division protein ZapA